LWSESPGEHRWNEAAALLDMLVLGEFEDFLTLPAYRLIA
jgi:hypothetical protein